MTYARAHLIDPEGGVYHVCSRCVRRAWLCGVDRETGYNFDHRRAWLEERILALAEIFSIDLYGYAVMSNHYHIVLSVDPSRISEWSDEDILAKWEVLCPSYSKQKKEFREIHKAMLLKDSKRIAVLRQRLSSLSWFMRFINEPLARLANKEDDCKGRFWEGRFKSQQLLDENAVLAAMVYVDLNPIRAGIAIDVTEAKYTSLQKRLAFPDDDQPIAAINRPHASLPFDYSRSDYIDLAQWTIAAQQYKRPTHSVKIPLRGSQQNTELWLHHYLPKPGYWQRANGSFESLRDYAKDIGQCWIRTRSLHLQQ